VRHLPVGLEACALAALAALAPPRASHPGGATPTSGATASDAAVSTDNLQGSATSPPSDQCLSGHQPAAWHDPCAAGIDAEDADGFTALHFAANMGLRRLSAALLACGAAVDRSTRDVSSLHTKTQPRTQDAQAQTVEKGETAATVRSQRWVPGRMRGRPLV